MHHIIEIIKYQSASQMIEDKLTTYRNSTIKMMQTVGLNCFTILSNLVSNLLEKMKRMKKLRCIKDTLLIHFSKEFVRMSETY